MQEKLVALEEKCHSMMLLKFGREVDLKKLENISTNRYFGNRINDVTVNCGMMAYNSGVMNVQIASVTLSRNTL